MPEAFDRWTADAVDSAQVFLARVSHIGLSPERMTRKYVDAGHNVSKLDDARQRNGLRDPSLSVVSARMKL